MCICTVSCDGLESHPGVFQTYSHSPWESLRSTIMLTRIKQLLNWNKRMFPISFLLFVVFCKHSPRFCSTDYPDNICIVRRDSTSSFYQPPPACDIEKMRNNMIKEQKVFALIREILSKTCIFVL